MLYKNVRFLYFLTIVKLQVPATTSLKQARCKNPMQIPQLESQRLILRGCSEEDLDAYTEMCSDPEVMRYIGEGKPLSRWESWRNMAMILGHWQLRGYGKLLRM